MKRSKYSEVSDRICDQTGGDRDTYPGGLPQDGHQRGHVL